MAVATGRTNGWAKVGALCMYVSGKRAPADADWNEYLAWLKVAGKPPPGQPVLSLVFDRSPGPSPTQRKALNDVTVGWGLRVAVITPSQLVRGMVTAMNWFKRDSYEAFPPEELDRALEYLHTPPNLVNEVRQTIQGLMVQLDR